MFGTLSAVLTACSLSSSYERPALPTAALYPGSDGAATQAALTIKQLSWREFLTDAELQKLTAHALENNRDLRIAMQRVEEAHGLYGIQRADLSPGISAGAMGTGVGREYLPAYLYRRGIVIAGESVGGPDHRVKVEAYHVGGSGSLSVVGQVPTLTGQVAYVDNGYDIQGQAGHLAGTPRIPRGRRRLPSVPLPFALLSRAFPSQLAHSRLLFFSVVIQLQGGIAVAAVSSQL